ncbi:MAG: hypothetical protein ACK2TV_08800, partial [Anaerolineales bacterium]
LSGSIEIQHALAYIRSMQLESGGWGDASTTAYVITTLNALDESSENWITDVGKSPRSDLFSYQRYNGAFVFSWEYPEDNLMSTATALLAIYGDDFILSFADRPKTNFAIVFVDPVISPIQSACVEFSGETISGLELLDSSGFSYDYQEGFINQILEISNQEGETNYWSFWRWDGRDWEFYNTGIAETIIQPGSIQAWYFTSWERFPSLPPDFTPNIEYICPDHLLVNFTDQPYIDFNNLFSETFDEDKFSEPVLKSLEQEGQKSSLPISFFVALGSILFIAMIVVLIKRNK